MWDGFYLLVFVYRYIKEASCLGDIYWAMSLFIFGMITFLRNNHLKGSDSNFEIKCSKF